MTKLALATALQQRKNTRKNLKRYLHTSSFNQLAGRSMAEKSSLFRSQLSIREARILYCALFLLFWLLGFYCLWF